MKSVISILCLVLATICPAFAADSSEIYSSGIFINVLIGFCALIVVAQLVPALMLFLGFIKASATVMLREEAAEGESPTTED